VNHQYVAGPDWITILITAGAPTVTALGVVGLGARYSIRRDERHARQGAYAGLVTAASTVLRDHRQLGIAYALNRSGDPDMAPFTARVDSDAADLGRAVAVAQLVGSDAAREHAKAIFERARASGEIYSRRSLDLLHAGPRAERSLPKFDIAEAESAHDKLEAAIEAFIDAVRPDSSPVPPPPSTSAP
jgi:hypothetical protein